MGKIREKLNSGFRETYCFGFIWVLEFAKFNQQQNYFLRKPFVILNCSEYLDVVLRHLIELFK